MDRPVVTLKNPIMLALDVDSRDQAGRVLAKLENGLGAIKIGPRLALRYGADFVAELARTAPVFVDNKYLDIPSTMEAAVRATFAAGATFTTVHAWAGREALERLAKVESELNRDRPFQILVVTILTSFNSETLPPGFDDEPIANHVLRLGKLALSCGLTGIVCSPQEVASLRAQSGSAFLVTPGIRLATDSSDDQKRVETPEAAIRQGASAIVVGRPIYENSNPRAAVDSILASVKAGERR